MSEATPTRKRMLSNPDYQAQLDNLKTFLVNSTLMIEGVEVPRFGIFSLMSQFVPFVAYDDPVMMSRCKTAFTDGHNCFFCTEFIDEILSDPDEVVGKNGQIFLAMHEMNHIARRHFDRMKEFPHHISNAAMDLSINTNLRRDFGKGSAFNNETGCSLDSLPAALNIGWGMKPGDIEKYGMHSEEELGRMMMRGEINVPPPPQNGQGQPGQPGQPGQSGNSSGGSPDGEPGSLDGDMITPEELEKILDEAGLEHVYGKDGLDMPTKDPVDMEARSAAQASKIVDAISKLNEKRQLIGDRMPGGHSMDYMSEMVKKLAKPKVSWKMSFKNLILGNGMKMSHTFDHPGDAYMIDPMHMGLSNRLYIGAQAPAKPSGFVVCTVDSSGSMSSAALITSVSEIFGMISLAKNNAPDIIVVFADTVARGEPIILTPQNYESVIRNGVAVGGRGGTDMRRMIADSLGCKEVKKRLKSGQKLSSMVLFTDLGDRPPQIAELEALGVKVPKNFVYMATPGTYNEGFASAVKDYAKVISMGERVEVDLNVDVRRKMGM